MAEIKDIKDMTPNPDLLRHLEKLTAWAKEGKIRSIVYCMSWENCQTSHGFVVDYRTWTKPLIGEMAMLSHDLQADEDIRTGNGVLSNILGEH